MPKKAPAHTKNQTPAAVSPPLLPAIVGPGDVQGRSLEELTQLAGELRERIISVVSRTGGHLAPSLGVVELTLAMLQVFSPGQGPDADKIIWDVGHQAYAYKLLTGRNEGFETLRTMGGISGFPKPEESPYDAFAVGHSSTSISAALGMAMARDLAGGKGKVVAVIGDGSMTAGLAFEGLNQAGHMHRDLIVVLNDNEMSISKNVGALSAFLSRGLSAPWLRRFKKDVESMLKQVPAIGQDMATYARRLEESFKTFFTPGMLFEAFRFNYMGPIDGHDMDGLAKVFQHAKELDGPVLVHVLTQKGRGYDPAEANPTHFHGVGCFEPETGLAKKFSCENPVPSYTEVFGRTLCDLARSDERIIAITAAMPEGTGLSDYAEEFPERFVDVGICEQHAVTFAGGLASQGYRPVVAIYSTFMQRSYDQIVHDVCLQNLNVTLCLDRGGLVGEDGPTHHGAFDLSYLRHIPNLAVLAPKDEAELADMLAAAVAHEGPVALRYPRGAGVGAELKGQRELPWGKGEVLLEYANGGSAETELDAVVMAVGSRVHPARLAVETVREKLGARLALFNARFVKPLDVEAITRLAGRTSRLLLLEENVRAGGFSSAVLELLADRDLLDGRKFVRLGLPDAFVEHGPQKALRKQLGLDADSIADSLAALLS